VLGEHGGLGLPREVDVPGEHGRDARNLLLLVHDEISRSVGLEVEGHLPGHAGQVRQQIPSGSKALKDATQRLEKYNLVSWLVAETL